MIDRVDVRRGTYYDSVRLMQVSRALQHVPGVDDALVAMATDLNLGLLADMGFDIGLAVDAGPNDLIVALRASSEDAIGAARDSFASILEAKPGGENRAFTAETGHLVSTVEADANVALISVPGEHAFVEAMDALSSGLHVMIFSDNVPVSDEAILKRVAEGQGLLVMGPDCGTAMVNGVGLGFANAVEPGPVGIVGAAGTGIQQLCCLLDEAGVGVKHALGTGSHDLSAEVGASSTLRGLAALDADPSTDVVVVVSKPPTPEVAEKVQDAAAACKTPTVVAMLGEPGVTLEGAAREALAHLGADPPEFRSWEAPNDHRPGFLRGLFSGGSLRSEAAQIASVLGPIGHGEHAGTHSMVDYGDDEYTRGRAHPMIDQRLRLHRLEEAALDPEVGVILLDVVLGYGAHPDPAADLAPMIDIAKAEGPAVVVSLCGSRADPQDRERQIKLLYEAGASVWLSNAAAARHAVSLVRRWHDE